MSQWGRTVKLTPRQYELLRTAAFLTRKSMTQLIRVGIDLYSLEPGYYVPVGDRIITKSRMLPVRLSEDDWQQLERLRVVTSRYTVTDVLREAIELAVMQVQAQRKVPDTRSA